MYVERVPTDPRRLDTRVTCGVTRSQEELRANELSERQERKRTDALHEGVIHTARNLGQIAAYFMQTGAVNEVTAHAHHAPRGTSLRPHCRSGYR